MQAYSNKIQSFLLWHSRAILNLLLHTTYYCGFNPNNFATHTNSTNIIAGKEHTVAQITERFLQARKDTLPLSRKVSRFHYFYMSCVYYCALHLRSPSSRALQGRETPQIMARTFIATRIVIQVLQGTKLAFLLKLSSSTYLLVINLRIPPLSCGQNFCNNLSLPPLLVYKFGNLFRNALLFWVMVENSWSVLRSSIWALAVWCGGIVHLVEELEELFVCNLFFVVCNLESFGIWDLALVLFVNPISARNKSNGRNRGKWRMTTHDR